ncbi:putative RNA recognition motif domain, nucleotide-binding alpha-beta plait domain superfamily [Helianthus debilis subsp. tardiflorus]
MEFGDDGGPWLGPKSKGAGTSKGFDHRFIKFFVSNIPEGCRPWDLADAFRVHGDIVGAFIAKKKNKEGRSFGFVKFKGVQDQVGMEARMANMKLGGNKLVVNIARFAKENVGVHIDCGVFNRSNEGLAHHFGDSGTRKQPESMKNPIGPGQVGGSFLFNGRDSRTFREVLGLSSVGGVGRVETERAKSIIVPDNLEAFKGLARTTVVGRVVNLETLVDFDTLLRIAKVAYVKFQYLGDLSLLISFSDEGSCSLFLDSKAVWGPWFSKLEVWNGQSLPLERVAWLRIGGIPIHLLAPEVLGQIGDLFGRVLYSPKSLDEEADLSFARVGVLVGEANRIKEIASIKWKSRVFRVLVEEELDVWVPDSLKSVDGSSSVDSSPVRSTPVAVVSSPPVANFEEPPREVEAVGVAVLHAGASVHDHVDQFPMHKEREKVGDLEGLAGEKLSGNLEDNHEGVADVGPGNSGHVRRSGFNGFRFSSSESCKRARRKLLAGSNHKKAQAHILNSVSPENSRPNKRPRCDDDTSEPGLVLWVLRPGI